MAGSCSKSKTSSQPTPAKKSATPIPNRTDFRFIRFPFTYSFAQCSCLISAPSGHGQTRGQGTGDPKRPDLKVEGLYRPSKIRSTQVGPGKILQRPKHGE